MPDTPAPPAKPETQVALVRVLDDKGMSYGSVFGVLATKDGAGWSFPVASLKHIIGSLTAERKLGVTLTDAKGKQTHWSAPTGTEVKLGDDSESVTIGLKKA